MFACPLEKKPIEFLQLPGCQNTTQLYVHHTDICTFYYMYVYVCIHAKIYCVPYEISISGCELSQKHNLHSENYRYLYTGIM